MSSKLNTRLQIIRCIFSLEITKGHLKWSVTELSRKSKLSRQTVYLYFGKTKSEILTNALSEICEEYFGLTPERRELSKKDFVASAQITRQLHDQTPEFATFYHMWRHRESEYQRIFIKHEQSYFEKLIKDKVAVDEAHALEIYVFMHGLVTAPFLTDKTFAESLRGFLKPDKNR